MPEIGSMFDFLRSDGSIVVNKRLARAIGLREAVLYSELLSRHYYFQDRGALGKDGYFYNTVKDLEHGTTMTRKHQEPAVKKLERLGLIKMKLAGVPAKRHFKIVDDAELLYRTMGLGQQEQEPAPEPDEVRGRAKLIIGAFQDAGASAEVGPELQEEVENLIRKDLERGSKDRKDRGGHEQKAKGKH